MNILGTIISFLVEEIIRITIRTMIREYVPFFRFRIVILFRHAFARIEFATARETHDIAGIAFFRQAAQRECKREDRDDNDETQRTDNDRDRVHDSPFECE